MYEALQRQRLSTVPLISSVFSPGQAGLSAPLARAQRHGLRPSAVAWALACLAPLASAQPQGATPPAVAQARDSAPARPAEPGALYLQADEVWGKQGQSLQAKGQVRLSRRGLALLTSSLSLQQSPARVQAQDGVEIRLQGDRFKGQALRWNLQTDEGWMSQPAFVFARTGAGGQAHEIDFLGEGRLKATEARYFGCAATDDATPVWEITARELSIDVQANEGVAQGAVLRLFGVPVLPAPTLSFPVTSEAKSGWLAPQFVPYDSRSGSQLQLPYYWRVADNRDLTLSVFSISRRGWGSAGEWRYLEPTWGGEWRWSLLPHDQQRQSRRFAASLQHDWRSSEGDSLDVRLDRVSDDAYWKDFSALGRGYTPRLLANDWRYGRTLDGQGQWQAYARWQGWQFLRDQEEAALRLAPYERAPQLGVSGRSEEGQAWAWSVQAEANRFSRPLGMLRETPMPLGERAHLAASLSRPITHPAGYWIPRLDWRWVSYRMDEPLTEGAYRQQRWAGFQLPTLSMDTGLLLEREVQLGGRSVLQTLEPRLFYSHTPYRSYEGLPLFDTAERDFNVDSIFSANAFSGMDRFSDAHQVTAGLHTRWLDAASGEEWVRLGLVQRYRFRPERVQITEAPAVGRFSDVLLTASARASQTWRLESVLQNDPDIQRVARTSAAARYAPGLGRSLALSYSYARERSEQVSVAWQWPLWGRDQALITPRLWGGNPASCRGRLNSVGRVNYSRLDRRVTGALAGFEYESECWTMRLATARTATGLRESTTRFMLQIELAGLSSLGSNPFQVLKDNILGYRSTRESAPVRSSGHIYD